MNSSARSPILLKPGDWQLDTGLNYTVFDHYFTGLQQGPNNTITPVDERLRRRLLLMPLAFRLGLCDGVQAFVNYARRLGKQRDLVHCHEQRNRLQHRGHRRYLNSGFSWPDPQERRVQL